MNYSILFPEDVIYKATEGNNIKDKQYFKDLRLDLIFQSLINSKGQFGLEKFYYQPLQNIDIISYRQEVMHELESLELRDILTDFSKAVYSIRHSMNDVREGLYSEGKLSKNYLIRGKMLDYAEKYCHAVTKIEEELSKVTVCSDGLLGFARYINEYVNTGEYQNYAARVKHLRDDFSKIEYSMLIGNGTIKVRKYEGQIDYSKKLLETFDKFRQGEVKDYRHNLSNVAIAGHVEAGVLDLLSKIYKDTFDELLNFSSEFIEFDDEIITRFSQEIQFYITWLDYIQPLKENGLEFNYPKMEYTPQHIYAYDCFDIALATKLQDKTVTNNFNIKSPESIIVVTGPNQGGKTTFAKMIGQIHYLASIGLCVPGKSSSLYIFDDIFTHFGKEEDLSTESGKLKDDLERIFEIITKANDRSLIIINEIFSSTTLKDAVYLGNRIMDNLVELKAPTIFVTFIDELALHSEAAVSMMSTVKDDDSMERTYKIIRKPASGAAYAIHIASKHNLTYEKLCRRLEK